MATGSLLAGRDESDVVDLGSLLERAQPQDDSFLAELLNCEEDDLLSSLLGPAPAQLSPSTSDPCQLVGMGGVRQVDMWAQLLPGSPSDSYCTDSGTPHLAHSPTDPAHSSPPHLSPSPPMCTSLASFGGSPSSHLLRYPVASSSFPDPLVGSGQGQGQAFPDTHVRGLDVLLPAHSPSSSELSLTSDTRIELEQVGRSSSLSPQGGVSLRRKAASLLLTEEEKHLLEEEGIALPADMPLTKSEQRHLKRVRRKIKNKVSAQESRRRKKEYVEGLEERVERCTSTNVKLSKRVGLLEEENRSLVSQLRRLQAVVAGCSPSRLQAGSLVMVIVLSFSLFCVPWLRHRSPAHSYTTSAHLRSLLLTDTDEFGNVIDHETGAIISEAGGQTPYPPPPWVQQSPAWLHPTGNDQGQHRLTQQTVGSHTPDSHTSQQ